MPRTTLRKTTTLLLLCAPLTVAGCSVSAGETKTIASVSASIGSSNIATTEIESQAKASFGDKVPAGAAVDCPEELKSEQGATTRCLWTFEDGSTLGMTVTVKGVNESTRKANLDFVNDPAVTPSAT